MKIRKRLILRIMFLAILSLATVALAQDGGFMIEEETRSCTTCCQRAYNTCDGNCSWYNVLCRYNCAATVTDCNDMCHQMGQPQQQCN
jgi:hypothetical protein